MSRCRCDYCFVEIGTPVSDEKVRWFPAICAVCSRDPALYRDYEERDMWAKWSYFNRAYMVMTSEEVSV
jgi:hypothetical protein